jgi:hypothetical protein
VVHYQVEYIQTADHDLLMRAGPDSGIRVLDSPKGPSIVREDRSRACVWGAFLCMSVVNELWAAAVDKKQDSMYHLWEKLP